MHSTISSERMLSSPRQEETLKLSEHIKIYSKRAGKDINMQEKKNTFIKKKGHITTRIIKCKRSIKMLLNMEKWHPMQVRATTIPKRTQGPNLSF